jgi:hypothetical protein
MGFSTLQHGTSLVELTQNELAFIGGGAPEDATIVMTCEVRNNEIKECTVKED